jgi:methyltransferase (TIGR00027 family)
MRDGTPSMTARGVAKVRATLDRPVTPDGDGEIERRLAERFPPRDSTTGLDWLERRTRWFDGVTLEMIEAGVRQVVIVAAGYDCRALRFRTPSVQFIELDHPDTQRDKRAILDELGAATDDIAYASADFIIDDVGAALAGAGHVETRSTLFLVEGLLVYLEADVIESLLRALRARSTSGSRLAVSMSRVRDQAFVDRVARAGEPVRTFFDEGSARHILERSGWSGDTSRAVVLAWPS